ncbi:nitrous oxide reductase accessory protein NosL [Bosea sp. (in: a-proteobacteria)]|uniref:nitrous oxide reductase accessory protein NosL n=1 Tax=Bosea sp. (in: a-proteobacteria) TaxID=1871050 RepID=UPI00260EFCB9|nr:nitrous oxide reductase accessory protein NosL [Bosea sp. (in: a-proteobacteria)]MCO5091759.1 nitrous oxide reductase accessory protein NosL [Bosea sp. (in: a-proteobacteria)]
MRILTLSTLLVAGLALVACKDEKAAEALPPPHELTQRAMGHYCGMNVLEHPGPKGQILLASRLQPVWFSSARDALSFTMLPEEAKDIQAIYVSDMGKATSWDEPGATNWVEARKASFVIGSRAKGGMGADEAVPFSERQAAEKFASENGGRVVAYAEMPQDYILGSSAAEPTTEGEHQSSGDEPRDNAPVPPGGGPIR